MAGLTPLPDGVTPDPEQSAPIKLVPLPEGAQVQPPNPANNSPLARMIKGQNPNEPQVPTFVRKVDGPLGGFEEWRMPDGRIVRAEAGGDTRNAIFNGMTLGFGDELRAGAGAAADFVSSLWGNGNGNIGQAYDDNLMIARAKAAKFNEDNPIIDPALQIVGSLPTAGRMAAGLFAKTPGNVVVKGAASGAVPGAVMGFGNGEGGVGERLESALTGGAVGGAVGGVLPMLAVPMAKGINVARNMLGMQNPSTMAAQKITQAFQRDGITPQQAADRLLELQGGGKPAALLDVGGENVQGLARAAAGTPGPAKQAAVSMLEGRQGTLGNPGQSVRILKTVDDTLGTGGKAFGQTFDDLLEQAKTQARPLYDKLYSTNGGTVVSDTLDNLSANPVIKDALRKGLRIAQAEGDDLVSLGVTGFNEAGDPIIGKALSIKGWDQAKRGLDDMIEAARRGGENEMVRALTSLKGKLTGELDTLTGGAYKAARQAYAGPMAMRDAMELGRNILKEDGEYAVGKIVASLGDSEKQSFLTGVAQAIRDKVNSAPDTANSVLRIFGNPAMRDKLKAAFPDNESYMRFAKNMLDEAMLYRNAQAVSPRAGSQTALRLGEEKDLAGDLIGGVTNSMITGQSPLNVLLGLVKNRAQGMNGPTAESLTNMLFNPDMTVNLGTLGKIGRSAAPSTPRALPYFGLSTPPMVGGPRDR